jgi:hypothetical protein
MAAVESDRVVRSRCSKQKSDLVLSCAPLCHQQDVACSAKLSSMVRTKGRWWCRTSNFHIGPRLHTCYSSLLQML